MDIGMSLLERRGLQSALEQWCEDASTSLVLAAWREVRWRICLHWVHPCAVAQVEGSLQVDGCQKDQVVQEA